MGFFLIEYSSDGASKGQIFQVYTGTSIGTVQIAGPQPKERPSGSTAVGADSTKPMGEVAQRGDGAWSVLPNNEL